MNRLVLKELCINNKKIYFNRGMNYIVGRNGTGKTLFFKLVMYALGLKSEYELKSKFSVSLLCDFGDKEVNIVRENGSNIITFETDYDSAKKFKVNSKEFKAYYNKLLEPSFKKIKDENIGLDILKFGFMSDAIENASLQAAIRRKNLIHSILGVDLQYTAQLEKDLDVIKKEIQKELIINDSIEDFMQDVISRGMKNENIDKRNLNVMQDIMNQQYEQIQSEFLDKRLFFEKAQSVVAQTTLEQEKSYEERLSIIEQFYFRLIKEIGLEVQSEKAFYMGREIIDNLKLISRSSPFSGSERNIRLLCSVIALMRHGYDERHNGSGLIFDDMFQFDYSKEIREKLYQVINEETRDDNLQYIKNLTEDNRNIPREAIILDLNNEKWGLL
ncbi:MULTISPECIES: ATP-binding protein [Bacillus cereus group]|uniref:Rad50/SbcC-type AAA domain-containing protein n=1 Tax=Bacillus toyonensis TaxID=155322 RepID=A0ABX6G6P2_9BACI|nr:ATP-binding protein [Bacillus toyonensis]MDM5255123.1 ATP-binding protein [Bacillus toyonensis]NSL67327.1 hypothetical protein [Bacillus toyonensis]PDZ30258.1 hypothetical protein CON85_02270 [Bacillus toyonensis]PHF36782.1 hypothetical protein COF85_18000 [Bacillus toyonensis]QHA17419.1 hypothetical protein GPA05_10505 [Bacillus toyonensis]